MGITDLFGQAGFLQLLEPVDELIYIDGDPGSERGNLLPHRLDIVALGSGNASKLLEIFTPRFAGEAGL